MGNSAYLASDVESYYMAQLDKATERVRAWEAGFLEMAAVLESMSRHELTAEQAELVMGVVGSYLPPKP